MYGLLQIWRERTADGSAPQAMKKVSGPLQKCELSVFLVKIWELVEWKCVSLLVSCCCGIPEFKYMSAVRQGVVVKRPSVRCTGTREDIIGGKVAYGRSLRETKRI